MDTEPLPSNQEGKPTQARTSEEAHRTQEASCRLESLAAERRYTPLRGSLVGWLAHFPGPWWRVTASRPAPSSTSGLGPKDKRYRGTETRSGTAPAIAHHAGARLCTSPPARTHDAHTHARTRTRTHARTVVGRAHSMRVCCQTVSTNVACVCVHVACCVRVRACVYECELVCVRAQTCAHFRGDSSVLCVVHSQAATSACRAPAVAAALRSLLQTCHPPRRVAGRCLHPLRLPPGTPPPCRAVICHLALHPCRHSPPPGTLPSCCAPSRRRRAVPPPPAPHDVARCRFLTCCSAVSCACTHAATSHAAASHAFASSAASHAAAVPCYPPDPGHCRNSRCFVATLVVSHFLYVYQPRK